MFRSNECFKGSQCNTLVTLLESAWRLFSFLSQLQKKQYWSSVGLEKEDNSTDECWSSCKSHKG